MSNQAPTILIPLLWGPVARLLLRSRVASYLVEMGARIVIASPVPNLTPLKEEFERPGIVVEPLAIPRERLSQLFFRMHSYFFKTMLLTPTSAVREEQMRISDPRRYTIVRLLKGRPLNMLFRLWRRVSQLVLENNRNRWLFEKYHPDLVVVSTLGRSMENFLLLRQAKRLGVRTLSAVQSWDTLTTKEYVYERPDKVVVWNEQNRDEACTLHNFAPEDVYVAGAPHFDLYFQPWSLPSRAEHLASLGLDPERQLLFVTGQPRIPSSNIEMSMQTLGWFNYGLE